MNRIPVTASKCYDVLVGSGILNKLGEYILPVFEKSCKIAIISDSNVYPLYGNQVEDALSCAGFQPISYVFPAGENSKNVNTYFEILNFLAKNHITRSDAILALGGGVTGDMSGFAAATYLRGIRYIQVPTTLLAMVDSSVGGKTAIDLPAGKNLVGAFYQPSAVLCDLEVLKTLPESVFAEGCAEIIKYGVLCDRELFKHLAKFGPGFDRAAVISRCIELKRDIVAKDEFDTGLRQKLNLGHTIGHGVEAQSNFQVSHGNAVAIGMMIVTRAAVKRGICESQAVIQLSEILSKFNLPQLTDYDENQLYDSALADKKRTGDTVNLIIPRTIGNCDILQIPVVELKGFIKDGL